MLFRLYDALKSFYNYINKILVKKLDIILIIYLNNIFIYIENLGLDHVKAIK